MDQNIFNNTDSLKYLGVSLESCLPSANSVWHLLGPLKVSQDTARCHEPLVENHYIIRIPKQETGPRKRLLWSAGNDLETITTKSPDKCLFYFYKENTLPRCTSVVPGFKLGCIFFIDWK